MIDKVALTISIVYLVSVILAGLLFKSPILAFAASFFTGLFLFILIVFSIGIF